MSKILALSSLSFAFALLGAASAGAQDKPAGAAAGGAPRPAWIVACEPDMKKHCQTEMGQNADVRPCLRNHEKDLSQACQDTFLRQYKHLELCKDDIEKVCGGAGDGKSLGKCFNEKQEQLSEKCKSALRSGSKQYQKEEAKADTKATNKAEAKAEVKPDAKAEKTAAKTTKANAKKKAEKN
jgi:hypothetical protein